MVSVLLKDRDLLFVHVPKTGGGSISRLLRAENDAVSYPVKEMSVAEPCITQLSNQLPKPFSAYKTVGFVRNPWDWTVSGFLHVTQNMPAYKKPPSFREFVLGNWSGATRIPYPDKFTTPKAYVAYHTQITPWEHIFAASASEKLHHICKFETLERDARHMFGLTGVFPHANKSERGHYATYYDVKTRETVAQRHASLIEAVGYKFSFH